MAEQLLVLIVDDDADAAEMYRLRLMVDGYIVVVAGDGSESLRMASELLPDFIYLDLWMPGLDGFQVLEQLYRSRRRGQRRMI